MQIYLNVCIQSLWATGEIFYAYNYRPQRSWAKVMFLQASVILSTRGMSASVYAGIPSPPQEQTPAPKSRHPPRADTPQRRHPPPPEQTSPPPERRHPPWKQTPAYGQRAAGTHPTGMHSCFTKVC